MDTPVDYVEGGYIHEEDSLRFKLLIGFSVNWCIIWELWLMKCQSPPWLSLMLCTLSIIGYLTKKKWFVSIRKTLLRISAVLEIGVQECSCRLSDETLSNCLPYGIVVIVVEKVKSHNTPLARTVERIPSACGLVEVNAIKFGMICIGYQMCIGWWVPQHCFRFQVYVSCSSNF